VNLTDLDLTNVKCITLDGITGLTNLTDLNLTECESIPIDDKFRAFAATLPGLIWVSEKNQ
jgi:hypothetical protein